MSKIMTLYHGSVEKIESPELGKGKRNNDYGQGFYCTVHRELACDWASKLQGTDVIEYFLQDTKCYFTFRPTRKQSP